MATEKTIVVNAKTDKAVKEVEKLNKATETTQKELKKTEGDVSGLSGSLDKMTGGAVSGFSGMLGSIKGVTAGFKTMRGAIIATGLGALVVIVGSLIAAFQGSEEGQNKLNKIFGVTGAIVGNLVDLFADFGEKIIEAVENPQKAWDNFVNALNNGFQFLKRQVFDNFIASFDLVVGNFQRKVLQARIAWNDFTGDSEQAEKLKIELEEVNAKVDEATATIKRNVEEVVNLYNNAKDAVKGFIDEQIEEGNQAAKVADMRAKADKIERNLLVRRAELENEIAQLRLKSRQEEQFSAEERRQALLDAQALEDELLEKETTYLQLRADAQALENTFARSNKQNLDDEARLKAAVIQQEARRTNAARATQRELNRINSEIQREEKARLDEIEKAREEANKREIEQAKEKQKLLDQFRIETEEQQLQREEEEALLELERLEANEAEKQQVREFYADKRATLQQQAIDDQLKQEEILRNQTIALTAQTFGQIANILGEQSKAGKAFAVAQALINTYQGITAGLALGFPASIPAVAFASATGFGAVKDILSTNVQSPSAGGGGSAANSARQQQQAQAPSFNIVGDSGTNQIADVLGQNAQTPQRSYVVSGEMTSQQELDRNIESSASLG